MQHLLNYCSQKRRNSSSSSLRVTQALTPAALQVTEVAVEGLRVPEAQETAAVPVQATDVGVSVTPAIVAEQSGSQTAVGGSGSHTPGVTSIGDAD